MDSELAMFGVEGLPTDGILQNKFYKSTKPIGEMNLPFLVLTARLDAPTYATCERMIRDAVEVEKPDCGAGPTWTLLTSSPKATSGWRRS